MQYTSRRCAWFRANRSASSVASVPELTKKAMLRGSGISAVTSFASRTMLSCRYREFVLTATQSLATHDGRTQRKTNGRTHAKLGGGGLDDARVAVADVADVVDQVEIGSAVRGVEVLAPPFDDVQGVLVADREGGADQPSSIGEDLFGPVMKYEKGHKFNLVLDSSQVERLITLLLDAPANVSHSASSRGSVARS